MTKAQVASRREVAEDIVEFRLVATNGRALAPFTPGAHVHVAVPSGGTRQYSLCNDPAETAAYVIAVKREPQGQGGSVTIHYSSLDQLDMICQRLSGEPI